MTHSGKRLGARRLQLVALAMTSVPPDRIDTDRIDTDRIDTDRIDTVEALRSLYRSPSALVQAKVQSALDAMTTAVVESARFVLLATTDRDGRVDVSPRGGPAGFIRVIDGRISIGDLNGNNLLDSLTNIVATGRVGMLVVQPGSDETLRINGRAWITINDEILDGFTAELKRPKSAIVIEPEEIFIHCAKAFRRAEVWNPESWGNEIDAVALIKNQFHLDGDLAQLRANFETGYSAELAEDFSNRPSGNER
jgi:uncharacterized protein